MVCFVARSEAYRKSILEDQIAVILPKQVLIAPLKLLSDWTTPNMNKKASLLCLKSPCTENNHIPFMHISSLFVTECQINHNGLRHWASFYRSWRKSIIKRLSHHCHIFTGLRSVVSDLYNRSAPAQMVEQTMETPGIWDAIVLIMTSLQFLIPYSL